MKNKEVLSRQKGLLQEIEELAKKKNFKPVNSTSQIVHTKY